MTKTAVISARVDPNLKQSVEAIFGELGINTTQAITMFFKQVELQQGLPFDVRIPNETTQLALAEAKARYQLESYSNTEELFDDLGI